MKRKSSVMDNTTVSSKEAQLVERNLQPKDFKLLNSYAVGKHQRSDIVKLAEEIQKADNIIQVTTCSKLQMIAEQIKFLQEQARQILLDAKQSIDMNHVACNFQKIPGHTYYLYERESGQKYLSMLSPQDWSIQGGSPHPFLGAYTLEQDMSWTSFRDIKDSPVRKLKKIDNCVLPFIWNSSADLMSDTCRMEIS